MSYEVKTPLVTEAVDAARMAIVGIQAGTLEPRAANIVLGGARVYLSAVNTDIKARIAEPKILASEAKLVEVSRAKKIGKR